MCFICERVIVEGSYELGTAINDQSKIRSVMPGKTASMTADWLQYFNEDCGTDEYISTNSEQDNTEHIQNDSHNTEIWYDAIDDISLLNKTEDFTLVPSLPKSKPQVCAMDENSENVTFYDAVDNFMQVDMEKISNDDNTEASASTSNTGQKAKRTCCMECCGVACQTKTDIDWEDGFEFYMWPNGECEDSESDCESDDEEFEDEEDFDDDNDFIIFEDTDTRTESFSSNCSKSSYKCTDKKPPKHVHFSPELVTVYIVTWSDDECRKGPWIQCAVDRMHFRHRIERLEQILTPCLLLKQKLGYKFIETMSSPTNTNKNMI